MMNMRRLPVLTLLACMMSGSALCAGGRQVASDEPGWPQWWGPRRDAISTETGLLETWPAGGPALVWTADGVGKGYSSPIVAGGSIFITGDFGDQLKVLALSPDGRQRWAVTNGRSWKKSHPGSRSSCSYDDGLLYHMNAHGRLACMDPADGGEKWSVNILEKYRSANIMWGISESVLVSGNTVIATPAGAKGLMVAFDKKTGRQAWVTEHLADEHPGYSSPLLLEIGHRRQIVNCGSRHVFGVDAEDGKLIWKHRNALLDAGVTLTPSFSGGYLFAPECSRKMNKSLCLKLDAGTGMAEEAWVLMAGNVAGNAVIRDGLIVGSDSRKPEWHCIEAATGTVLHRKAGLRYGSAVFADGRYYCVCSDGVVVLMRADRKSFEEVSRFRWVEGKKDVWAHPVVCEGRLYLRYHDRLYCYDISGK
ncbi:MAG: outer membrane protein assembly factor BamB family protein [Planctomycetota bacterium]|jgi:outer membrane protein assembly factor BamB